MEKAAKMLTSCMDGYRLEMDGGIGARDMGNFTG